MGLLGNRGLDQNLKISRPFLLWATNEGERGKSMAQVPRGAITLLSFPLRHLMPYSSLLPMSTSLIYTTFRFSFFSLVHSINIFSHDSLLLHMSSIRVSVLSKTQKIRFRVFRFPLFHYRGFETCRVLHLVLPNLNIHSSDYI